MYGLCKAFGKCFATLLTTCKAKLCNNNKSFFAKSFQLDFSPLKQFSPYFARNENVKKWGLYSSKMIPGEEKLSKMVFISLPWRGYVLNAIMGSFQWGEREDVLFDLLLLQSVVLQVVNKNENLCLCFYLVNWEVVKPRKTTKSLPVAVKNF